MTELPVRQALPQLKAALAARSSALLCAPPGSGKTTLVPLALLDQPWLQGQTILMLEPRRLAARAAAARMSVLSGQPLGGLVGYRVRMDSKVSRQTRIEVLTEGILTRRLQRDPELDGVGLVIFDEFHERNLQGDLALALSIDVQQGLREDLRLLVMSATLDAAPVAALLGDAPLVSAQGRSYPVEIDYLPTEPQPRQRLDAVVSTVRRALQERDGDLLVFLPGAGEIRRVAAELARLLPADVMVRPLFGDLSQADQDQALAVDAAGRRRVVLATDIAESSLTIDGVSVVIDAGLARRPRFDPNSGLSALLTRRISRASATQRAGRAGRLGPGACYRLWTEAGQRALLDHDQPELLDADLSALLLELAVWGIPDPAQLAWLDPPPRGAVAQASELLQSLGALHADGRPTARGRDMAELPLPPRLAHMLLLAAERGCGQRACRLAALLTERDILRRRAGNDPGAGADLELRLRLLDSWADRDRQRKREQHAGLDGRACERVLRVAAQWQRLLARHAGRESGGGRRPSVGVLLSWAWPDRVARRRSAGSPCYQLANGRGACLAEDDPLASSEWLVAAQLDASRGDGRIFLAAATSADELREQLPEAISEQSVISWSSSDEAVLARHEERIGALLLSSRPSTGNDPQRLLAAMLDGIGRMGLQSLPWTDAARRLQTRVLNAREWTAEADWPDLSDDYLSEQLAAWLSPWLDGIGRRSHLQRLNMEAMLQAQLDWPQQQRLQRLLPTHLRVPSGSSKALQYRLDGPPILAVRLQEMFGQAETPTVCDNSVPVLVHLLSPAGRPIQVTTDMQGFWQRTYREVRKELKGRYPKHYWPDDPLTAVATARVRPGQKRKPK